ncbi:MAG: hypothetical protein CMF48_05820 [Legionellales bacterium]|nr:hypothetical protein [Legionellales bacterium]
MKFWSKSLISASFFLISFVSEAQISIHITGIDGKLKHRLYNDISIDDDYYQEQSFTSKQLDNLAIRGEKEILQTLKSFGYYQPVITHSVREKSENYWKVNYTIEKGNPVVVEEVFFTISGNGKSNRNLSKHLSSFLPSTNIPFDHHQYETQKTQLLAAAIELGYLDAQLVRHEVQIDTNDLIANIYLDLETGSQYRFGEMEFSETLFDDSFLSRYASFSSGQPFSSEQMLQFQAALRSTKYFSTAQVFPKREDDSLIIPLNINLELKEPNNYLAGIGYTTDTGMRGRLGWERRYLNAFGHSLSTNANVAEKRQQYNVKYLIPGHSPATDRYQIAIQEVREEIDHRLSNTRTASISSLAMLGEWQRLIQLEYMIASYRELQGSSIVKDHFILPTLSFTKRVADDPLFPEKGYRLDINLRGAVDIVLSSQTFAQIRTNFKAVTPIFDGPTHLLFRTELGTTAPNSKDLPLMLRFYAGGDNSVRGYRYHSLGPQGLDYKGRSVNLGGKHLMVSSLEIDHPIAQKLRLAGFVDVGGAVNRFSDRFSTSVGTGIRWFTAVGPVRLDIARPLDRAFDHKDWRFHLSIGPDL